MIGNLEVAWLAEDQCQRLMFKGCVRVMAGVGCSRIATNNEQSSFENSTYQDQDPCDILN